VAKCGLCHEKVERGKKVVTVHWTSQNISTRTVHMSCLIKAALRVLVKRVPPAKRYPIIVKTVCWKCKKIISTNKTYRSYELKDKESVLEIRCKECSAKEMRDLEEYHKKLSQVGVAK
jgi:hypothetical protein